MRSVSVGAVRAVIRYLISAVVLTAVIAITTHAQAIATGCTLDRHCYGQVQSFPAGINGVAATINPHCLVTGTLWNSFVTDELWLADSTGAYWLEVGYIQNQYGNINGLGSGRKMFWAERTPSHEFVAHGVDAKGLPAVQFEIVAAAADRFVILFGGERVTTTNSMTPYDGIYGSETTTAASRNRGAWTRVRYHSRRRWFRGVVRPLVTREQPLDWLTPNRSLRAGNAC